jgi:hypothetical protein
MLFGFGEIALHQVGFAEVFVRASVPRIEHQRLLIMSHRLIDLPQTAIGVAKEVLDIGIAGIAKPCIRQRLDGDFPVAGGDGSLASREIRIERRPIRSFRHRRHGRADRPRFDRGDRPGHSVAGRRGSPILPGGCGQKYAAGTAVSTPTTAATRIERIMIVAVSRLPDRCARQPFYSSSASTAYCCIKEALASLTSTRSASASLVISASFRK